MMRLDAFEHTPIPWGSDGKQARGLIVRCPCGAAVPLKVNTFDSGTKAGREYDEQELAFVRKKLQPQGWVIGRKRREHRCPRCNALRPTTHEEIAKGRIEPMPKEPPIKIVADNTVPRSAPVVEPAPTMTQMSRDDGRIIFAKLNDVYVNERVGYSKGWSDDRVSLDLNVPREWVKEVRERFMGGEHLSAEVLAELTEAREAARAINALVPEFKRLLAFADRIEKTITEIEKVMK